MSDSVKPGYYNTLENLVKEHRQELKELRQELRQELKEEKEKMDKLLKEEQEKMDKRLKEKQEKMDKLLKEEQEKMAKQLKEEQEKMAKQLKEQEKMEQSIISNFPFELLENYSYTDTAFNRNLPTECTKSLENLYNKYRNTNTRSKDIVNVSSNNIFHAIMLLGMVPQPSISEFDFIFSNSLVFQIINTVFCYITGLHLSYYRDYVDNTSAATSSTGKTMDYFRSSTSFERPATIIWKEKKFEDSEKMIDAWNQLRRSHVWLPLYNPLLDFIVAIVSVGDIISVGRKHKNGLLIKVGGYCSRPKNVEEFISLFTVMINIGCWLASVYNNNMDFDNNYQQLSGSSRSQVAWLIDTNEVKKTYAEAKPILTKLYRTCVENNVPNMEQLISSKNDQLFCFKHHGLPVSLNADEPDRIRSCVQAVLECLTALHRSGFAHLDVCLRNIVEKSTDGVTEWCVIDFEFAAEMGSIYESRVASHFTLPGLEKGNSTVTEEIDCYMVGKLIENTGTKNEELVHVRDYLMDEKYRDKFINNRKTTRSNTDNLAKRALDILCG